MTNLAPGSYSYLIIIDGVGLICTCLWRKQKKSERFLNETIAWYEAHYPESQPEAESSELAEKAISPSIAITSKTVDTTLVNPVAFKTSCGALE